jgi:hypothetical protein
MDEFLELKAINIHGETVYVNRFGDLYRWKRISSRSTKTKFEKIDCFI